MKYLFLILSLLISISLISAQFGFDNPNLPKVTREKIPTLFDNTTAFVNNSYFLRGLTPQQVANLYTETDPIWTAVSGNYVPYTGATNDLVMGGTKSVYAKSFVTQGGNVTTNFVYGGLYTGTAIGLLGGAVLTMTADPWVLGIGLNASPYNIEAKNFIGNGSLLTGISGGNSSFNQSLTDSLYVPYSGAISNVNLNTKDLTTTGNIGIGTAVNAAYKILAYDITASANRRAIVGKQISSATSGTTVGADLIGYSTASGASSATIRGAVITGQVYTGNTKDHTGFVEGLWGYGYHGGTGRVADLNGLRFSAYKGSTGSVTNARAINLRIYNTDTVGAIDNAYSIYLDTPTNAGTINNYTHIFLEDAGTSANRTFGIVLNGFEKQNSIAFGNIAGNKNQTFIYQSGNNFIMNLSGKGNLIVYNSSGYGSVTAGAFYTASSVFDKSQGSALSLIKDSDAWKTSKGDINYSSHYAGKTISIIDYDRPVIEDYIIENCFEDATKEPSVLICKNITMQKTVYPYTKDKEVLDMEVRATTCEQSLYELKTEVSSLKEELCRFNNKYSWCLGVGV